MKKKFILLVSTVLVLYQLANSQNSSSYRKTPAMSFSAQANMYKVEQTTEVNRASGEWVKQQSVPNIVHDMGFANSTTGYMAGEWGVVYKSVDGGANWSNVMDLGDQYYWYGLHVFSADKVVVGGFTYKNNSKGYSIIRWTTNGGINWTDDIVVDTTSLNWIFGLDFVDENHGLATGSSGQVYVTSNGGMNASDWTRVIADTAKGSFYGDFTMYPDGKYYISGSSFCTSDNYGLNWTRHHSADANYDFGTTFPDKLHGWTGGGDDLFGSSGWVHSTTDGGATWSANILNPPYPVRNIYFLDTLKGFALGGNKYLSDVTGGIWATEDGGDNWINELNTDTDDIDMETMAFLPSGGTIYMWGVGASQVNGWHSTIYKKSQILTVVENITDVRLLKIYPNPSIGVITISYTLSETGMVEISIYDMLGNEVRRLVNNELNLTGNYSIRFDGAALQPGTYLCKIKTGSFSASDKIVIIGR